MSKIFLIAGLGADTRIYNNIDLLDYDVVPVDWIVPNKSHSLTKYAQKLINQYHISPNSIVIGNSLGGMLAVEIAKLIPVKKAILISSIKTIDEAPRYFSFFRNFPIYRLMPQRMMTSSGVLIELVFGRMNKGDLWLFKDMLKNSSPKFLKWAMEAVLKWDNRTVPPHIYQITGDKDLVFPSKHLKEAKIVKGGTHIMIFDKAKEVNKILRAILKKK